jgi:hypothetical protein
MMCPESKESRIRIEDEVPQCYDSIESYIADFQKRIPKVVALVLIRTKNNIGVNKK